ncbi:MAG TPA: YidC/Oxa1 family insertase periplasmic-domain containing protein, partial [Gemmatimonadaceae bacterium]
MDKRTLLAAALMALVIVLTPRIFSSRSAPPSRADSTAVKAPPPAPANTEAAVTQAPPVTQARVDTSQQHTARPITQAATLTTPRASFALMNPGAAPGDVTLPSFRDLRPGDAKGSNVVIAPAGQLQFIYRLAAGADTIALDTLSFAVAHTPSEVTFSSAPISLTYRTTSDGFRLSVSGQAANAPAGATLVIDLPSGFRSVEADTLDDTRHFAFSYKIPRRDANSVAFSKLEPGSARVDTGSFQWVGARTKYWLVALMQPVGSTPPAGIFRDILLRGAPRTGKVAAAAYARTTLPLKNGAFAFDLYVGPQSWSELHALGNDLENVNPYAGWLHPVVQPFATIVLRVLLWMKATLRVNYGWVLIIFGVVIRFLLWPLNNKAMRSSMQMQRLQPELTAIQTKYKSDPEKQRDAMMKVYQDHGMSPFSPMLGCLPMLLPMPVLFALYFVFQNTIEFRGVPFLWLPDLALKDPFYIIPLVMGGSMYLLSWIGMRSSPPNPQAKMMSYMMPVMFTFLFLNFASGLNLYYAVQNIAALPQQWFLSRERG